MSTEANACTQPQSMGQQTVLGKYLTQTVLNTICHQTQTLGNLYNAVKGYGKTHSGCEVKMLRQYSETDIQKHILIFLLIFKNIINLQNSNE